MKRYLLFCIAAFMILTSCHDFYFKNPQPLHGKELNAIPEELIGTYREIESNDSMDHDYGDTLVIRHIVGPLVITSNSYDLKNGGHALEDNKLSGTLEHGKVVLKKMDNFYVLSQKVEDPLKSAHNGVWEVYILDYRNDQLTLYNLASEDSQPRIDSIKEITPVKKHQKGDNEYYLINPSNKQFKKLLINNLYKKVGEFEKVKQ